MNALYFDSELQVQVLTKLPIQEAFYVSQFAL